ncbi:Glcg protein [Granulibacter bethesdensis CGDNIH4]|nr:Glcg protein [Granulibacter bethesdensis CGDNIH4]
MDIMSDTGQDTVLTLNKAQAIVTASLEKAASAGMKPLAIAVLDARGALKAFGASDGTSLRRGEVAIGKAHGAVALGMGSRAIADRAATDPSFVAAVTHAVGGSLIPVPGGVLIMAGDTLLGAVGASGDTSDNDEAAVVAGIEAAGYTARIR